MLRFSIIRSKLIFGDPDNTVVAISTKATIMARRCQITGKGPLVGYNVSHAHNKTKKRQLPNLRTVRIKLEDGTTKKIKVAASTLRTMRKKAAQAAEAK
jgi:large subunit ribosomal protein L28